MGSIVEWSVVHHDQDDEWAAELLGDAWRRKIEYREDHHGQAAVTVSGVVTSIHVVTCDRVLTTFDGPRPMRVMAQVPHGGRLREVQVADPWEPEPPSENRSTTFDGWIAELEMGEPT